MAGNFDQAREFFVRGVAHYESGRFAEAERAFAASLALLPGRASTLTNLGAVRLKLGKVEEAAALLQEALGQEPDNVEALSQLAAALGEMGRHEAALAAVDRAVKLNPAAGAAWMLRGSLLRTVGRFEEAIVSFRQAAAHGANPDLARYYLASLTGGEPPPSAPREYVQSLFDGYAQEFDSHLVEVLKYGAPGILVNGLRRSAQPFRAALDLGCGTGLCGALLRPIAQRLDGVDLSASMVERAQATGHYDQVVHTDVAEYLQATGSRYELVVAADVFVYVGDLEPVFGGVARVLDAGGQFCFSVETAPGDQDLVLQPSLRYAHSARYIRKLAGLHGFEISATAEHPIRHDQGSPIPGLFAWLEKH